MRAATICKDVLPTVPKGPQGQKRSADSNARPVMVGTIKTIEIKETPEPAKSAAAELGSRGGKARAAAFPRKYLDMIYRLYALKRVDPDSTKTPRFFGYFTRRYIYAPLAHGRGAILDQFDSMTPLVYSNGGRKYKFHSFLNEEIGLPALRQHLWQVIGIGSICTTKNQFKRGFFKAFPEAVPVGHQWELLDPEI